MRKIIPLIFSIFIFFALASSVKAEAVNFCDCREKPDLAKSLTQACFTTTSIAIIDKYCPPGCNKGSADDASLGTECSLFTGAVSGTEVPTKKIDDKVVTLDNPLAGNVTSINQIIGKIIKAALGVMGAFMLFMIVWGGTTWLNAYGNAEKVKAGANTIMWAVIGAVVVLASYMLLNLFFKFFSGAM
ncbi:MAG: hypothetical protein US58_C0021G0003 [Candidatus Magasanikbacteria bacterium GW2011_GWA2_37_8]|uniref:Uncharacterized protein n=1 Tax=Candidatus Magasanikbacteria bacterium GW2011_GWA2_37_8 TaxID=1619036 RepID=A0A0G0KIH0_9BACT|nr:MAG: hypothetical protein US58_C0021G0003 [Candidatus Magasanikbacteria bacterium GW2011_GWA2_37_8]